MSVPGLAEQRHEEYPEGESSDSSFFDPNSVDERRFSFMVELPQAVQEIGALAAKHGRENIVVDVTSEVDTVIITFPK